MPVATPKAPAPKVSPVKIFLDKAPQTFTQRFVVSLVLSAVGVGLIIGFRLAGGTEPTVIERTVLVEKECTDCAEERIQNERAQAQRVYATASTEGLNGQESDQAHEDARAAAQERARAFAQGE